MGYQSTAKRLRYSFWWPTLARDTKTSVSRCDRCVRRARVTCYDRVPIKSVERGATPFNHWCDVAGPLFPNQRVEYNYCFVACAAYSRWPNAIALLSVNARTICDCLMKIWMTFGVSQFVTMYNATYNMAHLTESVLKGARLMRWALRIALPKYDWRASTTLWQYQTAYQDWVKTGVLTVSQFRRNPVSPCWPL